MSLKQEQKEHLRQELAALDEAPEGHSTQLDKPPNEEIVLVG